MNSGAIDESTLYWAERRVLDHQRKLHRWARTEPLRRFADLFNLVCDRATLMHAWERVAGNKGSMTAGVDAVTRFAVVRDESLPVIGARLSADIGRATRVMKHMHIATADRPT